MTSSESGKPAQQRSTKNAPTKHVIHQQDRPAREGPQAQAPSAARVQPPLAGELRCVWTRHPHHDRRCAETIPAAVVAAAWRREKEVNGMSEGFFRFPWSGGMWLGYGLPDGRVTGTYCPTHRAERDARATGFDHRAEPGCEAHVAAAPRVRAKRARPLTFVE